LACSFCTISFENGRIGVGAKLDQGLGRFFPFAEIAAVEVLDGQIDLGLRLFGNPQTEFDGQHILHRHRQFAVDRLDFQLLRLDHHANSAAVQKVDLERSWTAFLGLLGRAGDDLFFLGFDFVGFFHILCRQRGQHKPRQANRTQHDTLHDSLPYD
jgi:hypothetical protein